LFVRDVWRHCELVVHADHYDLAEHSSVDFDPDFPPTADDSPDRDAPQQ
jgi:hypothetical protein